MVLAIRRPRTTALALPAVLVLLAISMPVFGQDEYVGDETCGVCHEETVSAFGLTGHAVAPGWDQERGCESCHGPGGEHAEGDVDAIERLGEMAPREVSDVCLACHRNQENHFSFGQAIHRLGEVGCTDCHSPHSSRPNMVERTGRALCGDCHATIVAQFDLPRTHPLSDGSKSCAGCHEPHATRALRSSTSLFDETCGSCHFEKAGPFLYSHDVVMVEGCASCHEVHGAPNRHLLKHETQVNLCYQCHSGSVTPSWHSAPRFLNEKCTACHSAIHGSNTSPFFLEE